MVYQARLVEEYNDDAQLRGQEVFDNGNRLLYDVWNLNDCPEDAIIGRCLMSAYTYAEIVRFGMELAQQGYTDFELVK